MERALLNALAAEPRNDGARRREMGERLFGEVLDELGLDVRWAAK